MRGHLLSIATLLMLFCASAMPAETYPLQLKESERSEVERMACQSRHGVGIDKIDAQAYGRGANVPAEAEVHCASHGMFEGNPVHHVVQCGREQGRWSCQGEWNEILVVVGSERIPVRVEGKISLTQSYQVVQKIANSGMFQGYSLRKALAPPCYVHQGAVQEFIDVKCQGWHIVVSTWCPQSECPRVLSMAKLGD